MDRLSESLRGDADSPREVVRRGRFEAEPDIVDEFESCESSGGMLPPPEAANIIIDCTLVSKWTWSKVA